jgi:hypothetical protein
MRDQGGLGRKRWLLNERKEDRPEKVSGLLYLVRRQGIEIWSDEARPVIGSLKLRPA